MAVVNTLAYCNTPLKSFVLLAPGLLAFFSLGTVLEPYSLSRRQGKYSTLPVCGVNLANSFGTKGEQLKHREFLNDGNSICQKCSQILQPMPKL